MPTKNRVGAKNQFRIKVGWDTRVGSAPDLRCFAVNMTQTAKRCSRPAMPAKLPSENFQRNNGQLNTEGLSVVKLPRPQIQTG